MIKLELLTLIVIICLALVIGFAAGVYYICSILAASNDPYDWEDKDD